MITVLFWVISQPVVVTSYRTLGTNYRFHLQRSLISMGISLQTQSSSAGRYIPKILEVHYPFNKAPFTGIYPEPVDIYPEPVDVYPEPVDIYPDPD
jgi:hypothetical protein